MTPTQPHEMLQWGMINAHQAFKNAFDSILNHLNNPPLHDLRNFLGYCEAFAESLELHHDGEERVIFPSLNNKLDFSGETEAHKLIHVKLDVLSAFIIEAKADASKFHAAQMKNMMEELREPLYAHLDAEAEHIAPERLKVFSGKELMDIEEEHLEFIKANANAVIAMPWMMSHTAPGTKLTWPPLPWFLRKVLIPYVFARRHSGYWKYSPYGMS